MEAGKKKTSDNQTMTKESNFSGEKDCTLFFKPSKWSAKHKNKS